MLHFQNSYMKYLIQYMRRLLPVLAVLSAMCTACKKTDGYNTVVSTDKTKPGVVTNIRIRNFAGGATITYALPNSPNILYVQAQYPINGKQSRQTKASYYSDSIVVSGFAKSQDYQVVLHTVSRANIQSDSVVVTVHPDTPPYLQVTPTVSMAADFGGVSITAVNTLKADVGLITVLQDGTGKWQVINQNYTNTDSVLYSLRGYDTVPLKFGLYVTDQWGNISDTVYTTVKPLFESQLAKSLFQPYVLNSDVPTGFGWVLQNLWDNNTGSPGYHTTQPIQPLVWPAVITFDMGQLAKLSRYTIWDRGSDGSGIWYWQAGAPLTWVLWGRADAPQDETMPDGNNLPAVGAMTPKGWINLGLFRLPAKPSGLSNPYYTNADAAFWNAGFPYNFSINLPKVRYIRFECLENVSQTNNFFNIEEMTFWGDPR